MLDPKDYFQFKDSFVVDIPFDYLLPSGKSDFKL